MLSKDTQLGSNFSLYLGIAVENKVQDSTILKVQLRELTPYISGDVEEMKEEKQVGDSKIVLSNTIEAEYFNVTTNRRYPPDVRRNEQVFIFKYGDTDKYYWCLLGRDDHLRNLERLNFSVSDNQESVTLWDNDNTYYFEMDTTKGHICISTSKSNEEQYRYMFKIDTKNNIVKLCDDRNNEITLDSAEKRIYITNEDGSLIDMNKKTISLVAPEDIILRAGRQIATNAPSTTINEGQSGTVVINSSGTSINSSSSCTITSPCIGLDGAVVAKSIVAGPVQAVGYSIGGSVNFSTRAGVPNLGVVPYSSSTTNIPAGLSKVNDNSPNTGIPYDSNRHCAAWEQVSEALIKLADALDRISSDSDHPSVSDLTSAVRSLAPDALMPINRGF